ncbi:hypothetical protein [Glycomyces xiaoerkulensis]|uniref:hypothetical protein n=1 Tax=Glycomyces xiaoerkulensis TaxID=2038139 RepID=UPI000C26458C|nr:hypothetical protein [Glycomyces xiaoerkulensis]
MTLNLHERKRLFRSHAIAVLRGDRREANRLGQTIQSEHHLAHQMFLFAVFTAAVADHFGDDLDRSALARLIAGLRADRPNLPQLKTEALVRVLYGEGRLYLDVPQADHPASMWAVLKALLGPDRTDEALADLFDRADTTGRELVAAVFESEALYGYRDDRREEYA